MKAINIKWDLDFEEDFEEDLELPTEIEIPEDIEQEDFDAIDDYISNITDYCHRGYDLIDVKHLKI